MLKIKIYIGINAHVTDVTTDGNVKIEPYLIIVSHISQGVSVKNLSGGPKRFHDSFNFVFHIVGECISCAADTHFGHGFDLRALHKQYNIDC